MSTILEVCSPEATNSGCWDTDELERPTYSGTPGAVVLALLLCLVLFASSSAAAAEVPELMEKYRCYLCHDDRDVGAGPAFINVAKHYRGHRHPASVVAFKIRAGASSGGPWHMPPHPEVGRRDAAAMARYILSLQE